MIKIWFFWTPHFAKKVLEDLYNSSRFEISFVVTWIPKPIGRSQILTPTPVNEFALLKKIPVLTPAKIRWNEDFLSEIRSFNVDYFVVVAYGKILPIEVLEAPNKMCVNVHWSILPLYRWASPIQSALINGDSFTWVTIMKMSEWMDEWDIIDIKKIRIDKFDTSETLFEKFEEVSGEFLIETLVSLDEWNKSLIPQDNSEATYCKKITKEDGLLDFKKTAENLFYLWRWLTPWPWIYTSFESKKLIITKCDYKNSTYCHTERSIAESNVSFHFEWIIWEVIKWEFWIGIKCWVGILILEEIKLEWKWNQNIKDFVNWYKSFIWSVL